jgi:hypothetical protein
MLPCVPLVPQKFGVHLHTKDQLTKQYYGAKNKRNRFTRKKGKVPLSWRCGDASWVSWCHFGELCVTGCVLCDSLTWPSLQLKKETVDNQSYKDNMICLCKKKRGCWWWNGCADLRRRVGAAMGQKERRLGQTLIRCCLYRNWCHKKKMVLRRPCLYAFVVEKLWNTGLLWWALNIWPMQLLSLFRVK